MKDRLSICRDADCPQCGFPETFAEGPADGVPDVLGCRKCGWREPVVADQRQRELDELGPDSPPDR